MDTFERSMAHWSEEGRAEMESFYTVATQDYRELAESRDWPGWLGTRARVLDVACGSGKFPRALGLYADLGPQTLTVDLLDPSPFSVEEAGNSLEPPFARGRDFVCTLQDLPPQAGPWPVVWATHALYAIPPAELDLALARFVRAIAEKGVGFIAHARADSFYMSFHRAYLEGRLGGRGTPFSTAEDLLAAFDRLGVEVQVSDIEYVGRTERREVAEGFLQRCLFDETVSLAQMEADPALSQVLQTARGDDSAFCFPQQVALIDFAR
ncbi:MAG: class I SAM-dependent methyltransferase [Myxococcota bacterium]